LFINEVQTGGASAADEFVEIYNSADCSGSFAPYKLVYRAATGTSDNTVFDGNATVPAQGYLLVAHNKYTGPGTVGGRFGTSASGDTGMFKDSGGKLAIKRDVGTDIADSMGWGSATGVYVKGTAAPAAPANQTTARTTDGLSTGNDSADFAVGPRTPGGPN